MLFPLPIAAAASALVYYITTKKSSSASPNAFLLSQINQADNQLNQSTEIAVSNKAEHQHINRKLVLSAVTAVAALSNVPLLTLLSWPLGVYLSLEFFQAGYRDLFKEKRVGVGVIDTLTCGALLVLGKIFMLVIFLGVLFVSQKLLLRTKNNARNTLVNIFGEQPDNVWVLQNQTEIRIPFEKLQVDDIIIINAGEMIPVDGIVVDGSATVDQHVLTGESMVIEKGIDAAVLSATIVLSGRIYVRVERTGSETVAAKIGKILNDTADYKLSIETRGEQIANKSALPNIILSGVTLVALGPLRSIAVMMAYIGYNLRITAPISVLNYLQQASTDGILIKDGRALEMLVNVDTVIFDKTGTLTEDKQQISHIHSSAGYSEQTVLQVAAALETKQTHPIALAILEAAARQNLKVSQVEDRVYELGFGLKATIQQQVARIGSERFMLMENIALPADSEPLKAAAYAKGHSMVYVALDNQIIGAIETCPVIRPEVKQVVETLTQRGLSLYIISGDHHIPTQYLAGQLSIPNYFAETLPQQKSDLIKQLQQEGKTVCFIGDGINDSLALKQADVSISLQGASTVATDTAQVILMGQNLSQLPQLFDLANNLDTNLKQGLFTTIIPGVICIGGVYFFHFGIFAAITLYNAGLLAGVINAMSPRLLGDSHKRSTTVQHQDKHQ